MHDSILEAVEYIHDHFTEDGLTVDFLAKMCGMSDTYFRKLFVKNFSLTPIDYIKSLKVNYARDLLLSGYYTVGEVSDKCGFNTINYFSSFMKKETGLTPSDLLKKTELSIKISQKKTVFAECFKGHSSRAVFLLFYE